MVTMIIHWQRSRKKPHLLWQAHKALWFCVSESHSVYSQKSHKPWNWTFWFQVWYLSMSPPSCEQALSMLISYLWYHIPLPIRPARLQSIVAIIWSRRKPQASRQAAKPLTEQRLCSPSRGPTLPLAQPRSAPALRLRPPNAPRSAGSVCREPLRANDTDEVCVKGRYEIILYSVG